MRYLLLLVLAVSLVGILTSPLAFSQNFDEMIPTVYAEKVSSPASGYIKAFGSTTYSFPLEKGQVMDLEWQNSHPGLNIEVTNPKGVVILGGSCETSCSHSFTANEDGVYEIVFESVHPEGVTLFLEWNIRSGGSSGGGGCLIATAAFGSEMAPQVQFLRELRDNTVLQKIGRAHV